VHFDASYEKLRDKSLPKPLEQSKKSLAYAITDETKRHDQSHKSLAYHV